MRACAIALFLASSALLVLAQQTSTDILERDAPLIVELTHTLDARKAKVGDLVAARLHDDIVSSGKIIVPRAKGKLVGHVSEVQAATKDSQSKLAITFDKVVVKDGRELRVSAAILAIVPPSQYNVWHGSGTVPTSGDNPAARAAGPRVDSNGLPVIPPHPPTTQAGPVAPNEGKNSGGNDMALAYEATGQTTVITSRRNLKLEEGTMLTVRLKDLPQQP